MQAIVGYADLGEDAEDAQALPLIFVSILLVFRTGYAYGRCDALPLPGPVPEDPRADRFMEGRGHIGSMVFNGNCVADDSPCYVVCPNSCAPVRDLARMMSTFVVGDDAQTNFDRANVAR